MTHAQSAIDIHRHFDAPRDVVYRAFTDESQVATWFGPLGGQVMADSISIEAKVGGHRRLTMATYSGAMSWSIDGTFTEVVENQRLTCHERVGGYPDLDALGLTLTIDFLDEGDGTRLELREGPCSPELEEGIREFWLQSFTKLDVLLARQSAE